MTATITRADGAVVCAHCEIADTILTRMKGLLGRTELDPDEGMLIRPANSIQTAFMRFPIDAVFVDRDLRVVWIAPGVRSWRIAGRRRARAVLELPAGTAARVALRIGDELELEPRVAG